MSYSKWVALMMVFAGAVARVSALAADENHLRMNPEQILKHIKMARCHDKPVNSEYLALGLSHIFLFVF